MSGGEGAAGDDDAWLYGEEREGQDAPPTEKTSNDLDAEGPGENTTEETMEDGNLI